MDYKDYYNTLGISRDASQDEVKRAYRKLARKYHPDVSTESDADTRFKEVGEAYEVLKDPEKRAAYDQLGSNWQNGQQFQPPPEWADFGFSNSGFQGGGHFSDFFDSLFGQQQSRHATGRDVHARLEVTLEQMASGAPVELALQVPQLAPDGSTRSSVKRLKVKVPPGLTEGESFRLKGQGHASPGGGPAGDLYVDLVFAPHPSYTVSGLDVHSELSIAPWQAVLGDKVSVATLNGPVMVRVPAGSTTGKRLRLAGRGLPGNPAGNHYVTLKIDIPTSLSERERELYSQLATASVQGRAG